MPQCGCFHNYDLIRIGSKDYKLTVHMEGQANLKDLLEKADLAQIVSVDRALFGSAFTLTAVREETALRDFLNLLSSRIIIDLAPLVEECYALAPYTLADEEDGPLTGRSQIGELVYRAKNRGNEAAADQLCQKMTSFISGHPRYANARFVSAVPPSTDGSANLPSKFVAALGSKTVIQAYKTRPTRPQKELLAAKDENALKANISNSVRVTANLTGAVIIVVDDTCGSGAILQETARACRAAGAKEVLGLVAAKDATFLQGGLSLVREQWQ